MFSLSLTRTAFSWFSSLAPNSITSWEQLEQKFHDHFFFKSYELKLSHLTSVKQMRDESVTDYIRRFRETKNQCFNVNLAEKDLADLAFNGLRSHIKEKLEGNDFFTVNQVHQRALAAESRSKELQESHRHHRPNTHALEYHSDSSDDESKEVYAAEFVWSPNDKPSTCYFLKPINKIGRKRSSLLLICPSVRGFLMN